MTALSARLVANHELININQVLSAECPGVLKHSNTLHYDIMIFKLNSSKS